MLGGRVPPAHAGDGACIGDRLQELRCRAAGGRCEITARRELAAGRHLITPKHAAQSALMPVGAVHRRDRGNQPAGIGMGRGRKQPVACRHFDQLAGIHDADAIGDLGEQRKVMVT